VNYTENKREEDDLPLLLEARERLVLVLEKPAPPPRRALVTVALTALEEAIAEARGSKPQEQKQLFILHANHHAITSAIVEKMLVKRGHKVVSTNDGNEAVRLLTKQHFDVFMVNIRLPNIDGVELMRLIRMREELWGGRMKIVAMSSIPRSQMTDDTEGQWFDGYISNTETPTSLAAVIEEVLELSS